MRPLSRISRRNVWMMLPLALTAVTGFSLEWRHTTGLRKEVAEASIRKVTAPALRPAVRLTGSVAALKSATITAPRVRGSRSALNRGGDFNAGGSGPMGGAGADFNLVLLSVVKPGSRVKAGDVVVRFDPQNQLQRLDDYKDAVVQGEENLQSLNANLAAALEAEQQNVRSAKAQWDQAVLDLQSVPVLSQIDAEKIRLAVEEDQAAYNQLAKEVALVEESQRAQLRAAELNLSQVRIEFQRAQENVERMTVKAPIDGIVVMATIVRNGEFGQIREGDQVYAGQPVVTIVDPDSMVLNATINQVDAERLSLGMQAAVRLDAYPEVLLPGIIDGIGAMAVDSPMRGTFVGEIPVRIQIRGTDPHLIPDLSGSAEISTSGSRV